ncbi:MAG: hypothetical protein HOV79_17025 [Hamadaea sp.]|nr:hypothetical protein [Hamadaea sp.]
MQRIVIRPKIQIPLLLVVFGGFGLIGLTYFTNGDVIARRDWFGIILGVVLSAGALVGIWRTLRLGVVIDAAGVRERRLDARDLVTPWEKISSIEVRQVGVRAGMPLYAPVLQAPDLGEIALHALGTYSAEDAEAKAQQLRSRQTQGA